VFEYLNCQCERKNGSQNHTVIAEKGKLKTFQDLDDFSEENLAV